MVKKHGEIPVNKIFCDQEAKTSAIIAKNLISKNEELYNHGRLFSHITFEKGAGVPYHVHRGDGEFYYILSGEGVYSDNGTDVIVTKGDLTFAGDGIGHGIRNEKDEPLEMMALILFAET